MSIVIQQPSSSIGGVLLGGTAGSILFINPTNTIAQDNANFFYDSTNHIQNMVRNAIATTTTSAISLQNNTGVTFGAREQRSPAYEMIGHVLHNSGTDYTMRGRIEMDAGVDSGPYGLFAFKTSLDTGTASWINVGGFDTVGNFFIKSALGKEPFSTHNYQQGSFFMPNSSPIFCRNGLDTDWINMFYVDANNDMQMGLNVNSLQFTGTFQIKTGNGTTAPRLSVTDTNHNYGFSLKVDPTAGFDNWQICDPSDTPYILSNRATTKTRFGYNVFTTPLATLEVVPKANTDIVSIFSGIASQSGNLTQWRDSTPTVLSFVDSTGELSLPLGSVSSPSLYFSSNTTTGIYSPSANQVAITVSGVQALQINPQTSSNGPFIGLFGTAPSNLSYILSSPTSTLTALKTFMSVNFTYNPSLSAGTFVSCLSFSATTNKSIAVNAGSFAAVSNVNNDTKFMVGVSGSAQVSATYTLTSNTQPLVAFQASFVPGTSANYTGGTFNIYGFYAPSAPTGYTGSGSTMNYYPFYIADTSGTASSAISWNADTNLYRSAAGTLKTDGSLIVATTINSTRITKRTGTTASSATPTINTDTVDYYSITALSVAITSFTTNLSGTPVENDTLWISITDNGTARAITWGAKFEASTTPLPTTTVISTRLDVGFVWNTVTSAWRCVAVS